MKFIEKIKIFLGEITTEMKKVSWSTRKELLASTWIVVISVAIFAIVLGAFDFLFSEFISRILRQGL